jgi:hypothetical protein
MLRRILILAFLGAFGAGFIGCHAEGDVGDSTSSDGSYSKKTTETRTSDGGYQKTETKTERSP